MRRNTKMGIRCMLLFFCMVMALSCLAGCKKKKAEEPPQNEETIPEPEQDLDAEPEEDLGSEPEPEPEPDPKPDPNEGHEDEVRSFLTGMWIPKEYENRRPYAVMFNNIERAYPQSGVQEAGILYEILAEGGITRLMGLFDYVSTDRIGSVRSARHYFVTCAAEYDSIFVHFGQTKYAQSKMNELGTNNLNGLLGEGNTIFFRDNSIPAPHNAFAKASGILKATENKGYRTEYNEGQEPHFQFSTEEEVKLTGEGSGEAGKISLSFSSYDKQYLSYDAENKVYYRYGYGSQHVDAVTKEPLAFTTALVQFVKEYNIDNNGYQTMELENSQGTGYYLTGGRYVPIYWSKGKAKDRTHYYYDEERTKEILLNPGKIYIAVFPSHRAENLVIEAAP
ncbi:MAG: DUF3048 domain-containing protein [Lachnospiraceae bacterium]|nr:DUF3048 domain-containing protein [Lachnospiraceae bacterium]